MNESFNSLIKGKLFQYLDIYDKMKYIPEEKKIETPIISPPSQKDVKEPEKKKDVGSIVLNDDDIKKKKGSKKKKNCC